MKTLKAILISTALIQGCTSMPFHDDHYASRFSKYGYGFKPKSNEINTTEIKVNSRAIKKYADRIAFDLAEQVHNYNIPSISVASYVDLDDNLKSSSALGNKLAEALIISLKSRGFKVVELNLASHLTVTDAGNLIFDRLEPKIVTTPFIVSGIINYTQSGVNINSRFIQTNNSNIIAAQSISIPNFVVKSTFPQVDGTDLIITN